MSIRYLVAMTGIAAIAAAFFVFNSVDIKSTVSSDDVNASESRPSELTVLQEPKAIFMTRFQTLPGSVGLPLSISFDNTRNILVESLDGVFVFNQTGVHIRSYASLNDPPFRSSAPYDSEGNYYVVKSPVADGWITKFSSSGNVLVSFGSLGVQDGQFNGLIGMDVDMHGNIYVADSTNDRIQVFDSNGNHLLSFGGRGFQIGDTINPTAIAVGDDGSIYVASDYALQKFEPIDFGRE